MDKKIIYKKDQLLGSSAFRASAMKDIAEKDTKNVLNQYQEKKQLFDALKNYRDGGVTEKEMRGALADLKYGHNDDLSAKEINNLAKDLGLKRIEKKDLSARALPHMSHIARAHHAANFSPGNAERRGSQRALPGDDDIAHYSAGHFLKKLSGTNRKKSVVRGDLIFNEEEEDELYYDARTGKRISQHTTRLSRPHVPVKNQASLRGRGIIGGRRGM